MHRHLWPSDQPGLNQVGPCAHRVSAHRGLFLLEVTMENILSSLFSITLFPFTSGTDFMVIPCMMAFVIGSMMLIGRMIRGRF